MKRRFRVLPQVTLEGGPREHRFRRTAPDRARIDGPKGSS
jgi:hypothetical protein